MTLANKHQQTSAGGERKKKRRTTEESDVSASATTFMTEGLAFQPSSTPAALSADVADGSPHRRRKKKAHKTRGEPS